MEAVNFLDKIEAGKISTFNVQEWENSCYDAMNDDFNTPILIANLFEAVKVINHIKEQNASFLLRGLRNPADFEFEKAIAQANREMVPDLETVFLLTSARYSYISSSIVRDVFNHNGDFSHFVPATVRP